MPFQPLSPRVMKHSIFLPLLLFVSLASFSQKKTVNGYYINLVGDTIKGQFPQYKQPERNPVHIEFISTDNRDVTLTSQNCISFHVNGYDSYIAYNGPRMINPIDGPWEDKKNEFSNKYDTIHSFLRIIYQEQAITLYSYQDKIRVNFFYKISGNSIIELEKKLYNGYDPDHIRITQAINIFRDQLNELFAMQIETKKLQPKLNSLKYTERDLLKFMDLLNGTDVANQSHKKYPLVLFVGTGASFSSLDITGDKGFAETQIRHRSPVSPVLIFGANFYANRNTGRILISPRIKLYQFTAKGTIDRTPGTPPYIQESKVRSDLMINPSAMIGYNIINKPRLTWYTSAGFGGAIMVNGKETQTIMTPTGTSNVIIEKNIDPLIFVINIETGINVAKNIAIWLNYQPPTDAERYFFKSVKFSSFQAGLSWLFR